MTALHLATVVDAIGWALVHSAWQGALIGVICLLILTALPAHPVARYRVALAGLVAIALAFVATVLSGLVPTPLEVVPASDLRLPDLPLRVRLTVPVAVWAVGVAMLSVREAVLMFVASSWRRSASDTLPASFAAPIEAIAHAVGLEKAPPVLVSTDATVPLVLGALRPVVLIPKQALENLLPEQLQSILAHEFAHIQRLDPMVNALQTIVDVVLFFHPAVWWLSSTVRKEREHCCDDVANTVCGDPISYARALVELAALPTPALGVASTGGDLTERVRRIVGLDPSRPSRPVASLLAAGLLGIVVADWAAQASSDVDAGILVTEAQALYHEGDFAGALQRYEAIQSMPEPHAYEDHVLGRLVDVRLRIVSPLLAADPDTEAHTIEGPWGTYEEFALPPDVESFIEATHEVLSHPFGDPSQVGSAEMAAWVVEHEQVVTYTAGQVLAHYHHMEEARPLLETALVTGDPAGRTTRFAASMLLDTYIAEGDLDEVLARSTLYRDQAHTDADFRANCDKTIEAVRFNLAKRAVDASPNEAAAAFESFSQDFPDSEYRPLAVYNQAYYTEKAGQDGTGLFEAFLSEYPDHEYAEPIRANLAAR